MHKILTLDNLYQFFVEQNKSINFSAKENGSPIVVSMPANFEVSENGDGSDGAPVKDDGELTDEGEKTRDRK